MQNLIRLVLLLPAVLFVVIGIRWLVDPAASATALGFVLGDGTGRSSQVGDFGAFFLTCGICILCGLVSGRRLWFYPPALMLLLAAVGRLLAWVLHDASFAGSMLGFELIVALLLFVGSRFVTQRD